MDKNSLQNQTSFASNVSQSFKTAREESTMTFKTHSTIVSEDSTDVAEQFLLRSEFRHLGW